MWGIQRTDDFGDIVFNLVEAGLMNKTDEDTRKDSMKFLTSIRRSSRATGLS